MPGRGLMGNTCRQGSAKSRRLGAAAFQSFRMHSKTEVGSREREGIRSQSAAHPVSHPRFPSSVPSVHPSVGPSSQRANRSRRGAAVAHLSCVIVSPLLSLPLTLPPHPNSQCFSLYCPFLSQEDYVKCNVSTYLPYRQTVQAIPGARRRWQRELTSAHRMPQPKKSGFAR